MLHHFWVGLKPNFKIKSSGLYLGRISCYRDKQIEIGGQVRKMPIGLVGTKKMLLLIVTMAEILHHKSNTFEGEISSDLYCT